MFVPHAFPFTDKEITLSGRKKRETLRFDDLQMDKQ